LLLRFNATIWLLNDPVFVVRGGRVVNRTTNSAVRPSSVLVSLVRNSGQ
jgi:hypothetical protein